MVEPVHGEINYDSARKNPLKFYDKLAESQVVHHKVSNVSKKHVEINS